MDEDTEKFSVLEVEKRAEALARLARELEKIDNNTNRQKTWNLVVATCLVVIFLVLAACLYVVVSNRRIINTLNRATGESALRQQAEIIAGLKCDNREALGEALASLGITPPPTKEGCPPYSVTIAPHDGQPAQQQTVQQTPASQQQASPSGPTYIVYPTDQPQQEPEPEQPQPDTPTSTEPPSTPPTTTCAIGVPLFGCVVTSQAEPLVSSLL